MARRGYVVYGISRLPIEEGTATKTGTHPIKTEFAAFLHFLKRKYAPEMQFYVLGHIGTRVSPLDFGPIGSLRGSCFRNPYIS